MIWLVGSLAYGLVGLVLCRILTPHFAWSMYEAGSSLVDHRPDGGQWAGAFCLALLVGLFWPLAVLAMLNFPTVGAASRAKLREQEQRIHEPEREAGIT